MDYVENTHETAERIKRLWKKYGNLVVMIIVIIMAAILGLQTWHKHTVKVAAQASAVYENLLMGVATKKIAQTQGVANQLISDYASSPYAKLAALILAKQAVADKNLPMAVTKLQWVIKHAKVASIKAIAQLRLARVLLAEKQPQAALTLLQSVTEQNMLPEADSIKGDAYLMLKQTTKAKAAYQQALKSIPLIDALYRYTQMKLYSL